MTNYDHINGMDSAELASFIVRIVSNDRCAVCTYDPSECRGQCVVGVFEWLNDKFMGAPTYNGRKETNGILQERTKRKDRGK